MPYGKEALLAQSTQPHATPRKEANPICPVCGFRIYPLWGIQPDGGGSHASVCTKPDADDMIYLSRRHAELMVANLHFYRIHPVIQVSALATALVQTIVDNCTTDTQLMKLGLVTQQLIRRMELARARKSGVMLKRRKHVGSIGRVRPIADGAPVPVRVGVRAGKALEGSGDVPRRPPTAPTGRGVTLTHARRHRR